MSRTVSLDPGGQAAAQPGAARRPVTTGTARVRARGGLVVTRDAVGALAIRLSGIAFAIAIVLSPLRVAVVLLARPVPPVYSGYTDILVSWSGLAVLSTLALWLGGLALRPRAVSLGPAFLRWPIAALLASAWIGIPWSVDPATSAYNALEITALAGLAVYAANEIRSLRELTIPLAVMVAIQAPVALGQLVAQRSLGLGALGELDLNPMTNGVSVVATSATDRLLRAYGLTEHPNILGGLLVFALPLLVVALDRAGVADGADATDQVDAFVRANGSGRPLRVLVAATLTLAIAALLATFSRSAWLAGAVAIALGAAMLLRNRQWPAARGWLVTGLVAFVLTVPFLTGFGRYVAVRADVANPTVATETMSSGERTILVQAVAGVFASHPLVGTGLGTLPLALRTAHPGLTFDLQPAPVVLLDVAAEVGLLGAVCYAGILVGPWLALWFRRRRWTPELVATSASLAALTVVGLFDYYTWTFAPGRIWAWLVIGLWARAYSSSAASNVAA